MRNKPSTSAFYRKFFAGLIWSFFLLLTDCHDDSGPKTNKMGCIPKSISPCSSTGTLVTDPSAAANLLIGTWNLQRAHYEMSSFYVSNAEPYPDACNIDLTFKSDMTFEYKVGDRVKTGAYSTGLADRNVYFELLHWSPPPYPTDYRVFLFLQPDVSIDEFQYLTPPVGEFSLSGFLDVNVEASCMEIYHWSQDRHGYTSITSGKFVKNN